MRARREARVWAKLPTIEIGIGIHVCCSAEVDFPMHPDVLVGSLSVENASPLQLNGCSSTVRRSYQTCFGEKLNSNADSLGSGAAPAGGIMTIAKREFVQLRPKLRDRLEQPRGKIECFFHNHIFVVLGEPGLGKTTSFEFAAGVEDKAEFIRIGEFLSAPHLDHWSGKVLYLDGLDEHRSRANGVDVMDALISRLKSLGSPKARISCRTAEWHGGKDIDALSAVSNGEAIVQLELQPLSPDDVIALVPAGKEFVSGARQHGLDEFLSNPQDFHLLYQFYREQNAWPDNRTELMEGACKALLKELNKDHYDAVDDWVSDRTLSRASDYLAAILLLSNVSGVACDRINSSRMFPAIHEFDGDLFAMKVAVGRHVFKAAERKRIEPRHRKIAEYMAARYLASRVREGLSLRRVVALMTGIDGGTAADLRGVYAWLVTMLSGMADHVLVHDPYGALIYGDLKAWTPHAKKCALLALESLSTKDPWFRGSDWSRAELGGLSDPALLPEITRILANDKCDSHLVSTILDAVAAGPIFPELGDLLLKFIRDPGKPDYLRSDAVEAFANTCPSRLEELELLLNEVNENRLKDSDDYLRGSLLRLLYPKVIGPDRVLKYLKKPSDGVIGWYHVFFRRDILEITPREDLPILAERIKAWDSASQARNDYHYNAFLSRLVRLLIENFGKDAPIPTVLSWLELGVDEYESNRIEQDEIGVVRDFLATHDQKYNTLFLEYFERKWGEESNWHQIWWRFQEVVAHVPPPATFAQLLLSRLDLEVNPDKAREIYALACAIAFDQDPALSKVTYDDLWSAAEQRPQLAAILEQMSVCRIEDWRMESAQRRRKRQQERATRQTRNIANFEPHKKALAAGTAIGFLEHCARIWYGLFSDVDREARPIERLKAEIGDDLAEACVSGFRNALKEPCFNSVKEIAETQLQNRYFYRGFLMLAGMDALGARGVEEILSLPDDVLRVAIAYDISSALERKAEWLEWLATNNPKLIESALEEFWRVQFNADPERVTGFYTFNGNEPLLEIKIGLIPQLLTEFPNANPTLLESMLLNAVLYCSRDKILPRISSALHRRFRVFSGKRAMWMAAGFALAPDEYYQQLQSWLKSHESDKWSVFQLLMARIWDRDRDGKLRAPIEYRKQTLEILGKLFENVHFDTHSSGFVGSRDAASKADDLRKLIHSFAEEPSAEAAAALSELHQNKSLAHWKTDLLFTIANQVRTARAANFRFPDVSEVVSTLSNAEPANVADLRALVVDSLNEIAEEIRHGNTDGYKDFWNVEGGKATDVHVDENTARDRLLNRLRPKLRHLDIVAEPEVRYAEAKRADIAVYSRGMKLPVEIKRDDHKEIWSAAENQLKKQYSRDPASEGNGVYLAFWLDGKGLKTPPIGIRRPTNAAELRAALRATIPEPSAGLIDVVVIDASVPPGKQAGKRLKKKIQKTRSTGTKRTIKREPRAPAPLSNAKEGRT